MKWDSRTWWIPALSSSLLLSSWYLFYKTKAVLWIFYSPSYFTKDVYNKQRQWSGSLTHARTHTHLHLQQSIWFNHLPLVKAVPFVVFAAEGLVERCRDRCHPSWSSPQAWHDPWWPVQHQRINRRNPLQSKLSLFFGFIGDLTPKYLIWNNSLLVFKWYKLFAIQTFLSRKWGHSR